MILLTVCQSLRQHFVIEPQMCNPDKRAEEKSDQLYPRAFLSYVSAAMASGQRGGFACKRSRVQTLP
eukprot:3968176-Amphidinium_carterae.1